METKEMAVTNTNTAKRDQTRPIQSISSTASHPTTTRRRAHTPAEWEAIRPRLKYYYIDLNMTLQNVMQMLKEEKGFDATVQMYKKRLRSWGMVKNMKAHEKEEAMVTFLQNSGEAPGPSIVRYDKIVRYAKAHSKRSDSSDQTLNHFIMSGTGVNSKGFAMYPLFTEMLNASPQYQSDGSFQWLSRSPPLPGENGQLHRFMRAMQSIIEKERKEWLNGQLSGQQTSPEIILNALTKGIKLWHKNDTRAARLAFGRASQIVSQDLQGSVFVSRIAYCISSLVWRPKREAVFQKFAEFMAKVALETLGHASPMTIVLQHLQNEQSIDSQLAIWACALDEYQISEENVNHWWGMAKRRWRWCQSGGKLDLAERYCTHSLNEARRIGKLSDAMEEEALQDLRSIDAERYQAKLLEILQCGKATEFTDAG